VRAAVDDKAYAWHLFTVLLWFTTDALNSAAVPPCTVINTPSLLLEDFVQDCSA
jgi:hypothetical protein